MSIKDGGPAFPCNRTVGPTDGTVEDFRAYGTGDEGMSLRDWFAGQAMIGVMAATYREFLSKHTAGNCEHANLYETTCAGSAYALADAMLAMREVKP